MKVGRNDPCPCGSGQKYKKCCEQNKVVAFPTERVNEEIIQFHQLLMNPISERENEAFKQVLENRSDMLANLGQEDEIFEIYMIFLYLIFLYKQEGQTVFTSMFEKEKKKGMRLTTASIIEQWPETTVFSVFNVVNRTDHHEEVRDLLTGETYTVYPLLVDHVDDGYGKLGLGMLFKDQKGYHFFPEFVALEPGLEEAFFDAFLFSAIERYAQPENKIREWLANHPYELLDHFIRVLASKPDMDEDIQLTAKQEEVIDELDEMLAFEYAEIGLDKIAVLLWEQYCKRENPIVKKPSAYAAAIEYLINQFPFSPFYFTQSELAEKYGVSAGAIGRNAKKIESTLADINDDIMQYFANDIEDPFEVEDNEVPFQPFAGERAMAKIQEELSKHNFESLDELNAYLNELMAREDEIEMSESVQAQDYVYEAMGASGKKRYELIQAALNLNPKNVDAHVLLGDESRSVEEAAKYYKKAIALAEQEIQPYLEQNRGDFWVIHKTRPYMRALDAYADLLNTIGESERAVAIWEEMLELNPSDNQGIRFNLLGHFLESGQYAKCKPLFDEYGDDGSLHLIYGYILYLFHTSKGKRELEKAIKKALERNPHVPARLKQIQLVPSLPHASYQIASPEEAESYVFEHGHLWQNEKELLKKLH